MHSYCCIAFGCLNSNLIFNSFDCVFSKKCKPFSFIPFPPFSFPAHLCFEDQPLKSVGRPSVHPLQTLTALLLAQLRLLNPTTRSRLPPLIFFFASSRTLQPLGLTGPTATASHPAPSRRCCRCQVGPTYHAPPRAITEQTRVESRPQSRPRPPRTHLPRRGAHAKALPLSLLKGRRHQSARFPKP
jgi:hypothetical protein